MNLFVRYEAEPDEELDQEIVDVFEHLGFQVTFAGQDIIQGNRDIWFSREDPFEDLDSGTLH